MSTTFALLSSAAAAPSASTGATDIRLAACAAVVFATNFADRLPKSRRSRSYRGRTCCSNGNLYC